MGTKIFVAMITANMPTIIGTAVLFTISKGDIFAIPAVATTTPETGDIVRPIFDACNIGITKNAGLIPISDATLGINSTRMHKMVHCLNLLRSPLTSSPILEQSS